MHRRTMAASPPAPALITVIGRIIGALTSVGMAISAAGILISLALITWSVVMRYVFHSPPAWVDDVVGMLLVAIVMLAAGSVLRRGEHIGVDVLTSCAGKRGKFWTQVWSSMATALTGLLMVINGWDTAMSSKMIGITTTGHIEIPVYWLQLLLPLGGLMLMLVSLEALARLAAGVPSLAARHGDMEEVEE